MLPTNATILLETREKGRWVFYHTLDFVRHPARAKPFFQINIGTAAGVAGDLQTQERIPNRNAGWPRPVHLDEIALFSMSGRPSEAPDTDIAVSFAAY
jgi:hypothetical protein